MKRLFIFLYSIVCYFLFLASTLYAMGFLNNLIVPTTIEGGVVRPVGQAFLIDVSLIFLFGLAHSVMARPQFKAWWTRLIPEAAERSTYVLQSSLLLLLIFWLWQPIPEIIWTVTNEYGRFILQSIHWIGWILVILATFLINHFELTGLQQSFCNLRRRQPVSPHFVTPFLYKVVRHPMQLGLIIAFWVTPHMSVGRLVFAVTMTLYILIGLYFEEQSLLKQFGQDYEAYRQATPKVLPIRFGNNHLAEKS